MGIAWSHIMYKYTVNVKSRLHELKSLLASFNDAVLEGIERKV